MNYKRIIYDATYESGTKRTKAHEAAEDHRFKKEFLFKNKKIPKDLYIVRLIQQFVIIKNIEARLHNLSETDKSQVSAFFALSYLKGLWRTPAMEQDLRDLKVDPNAITPSKIAKTTSRYLKDIENLPPKMLLGHFLLHVAGFMYGGAIIQTKYIKPSNALTNSGFLTRYQIPAAQYKFFDDRSPTKLCDELMDEVNTIKLDEAESKELSRQCIGIYHTMAGIYDDLCGMYIQQPKLPRVDYQPLIGLLAFIVVLKLIANYFDTELNYLPEGPSL